MVYRSHPPPQILVQEKRKVDRLPAPQKARGESTREDPSLPRDKPGPQQGPPCPAHPAPG